MKQTIADLSGPQNGQKRGRPEVAPEQCRARALPGRSSRRAAAAGGPPSRSTAAGPALLRSPSSGRPGPPNRNGGKLPMPGINPLTQKVKKPPGAYWLDTFDRYDLASGPGPRADSRAMTGPDSA